MCLSIAVEQPERILGEGEHLGLEWMIAKNEMGYRCGYVRVPKGHPCHGGSGDDLSVHGGITFAEKDISCDKPGEDDAWWFGLGRIC
jgi:hypothetical protein